MSRADASMRAAQARHDAAEPEERGQTASCPTCGGWGSEMAEDRDGIFEVACSRCAGTGEVRS